MTKITNIYEKEKDNELNKKEKGKKDIKDLTDKIYIINNSQIPDESKPPIKIQQNEIKYDGLDEKQMKSFLENTNIPQKHLNLVIKEIIKLNSIPSSSAKKGKTASKEKKNNNESKLLLLFLSKNESKIDERNIIYILKKIKIYNQESIDEIMKYIIINIKIDSSYFLDLIKEEEKIINKQILDSFNKMINNINDDNKKDYLNLVKTLNLTGLLQEIINKEEYDIYENNINKIFDEYLNIEEKCSKVIDKEFNEDFNLDFINSMKLINSNNNKTYVIQEKIAF